MYRNQLTRVGALAVGLLLSTTSHSAALASRSDKPMNVIFVLADDLGWSDVGSWSSLWENAQKDEKGNFIRGEALLEDTEGCYVHSERSLVSTIGIENLVIVDTPDALLVADRDRSQEVSKVVQKLRQSNRKEQEQHLRNYRPWGYFETLAIVSAFAFPNLANGY